jgi:molybdopterin-binding protein
MEAELLLEALARSASLRPFYKLIDPVEAYDRERGGDLVRTLEVFFATNGNATEAADLLFLHRNSLLYRLKRIQELTGVDLNEPKVRLGFQLGLLQLQRNQEEEPMQISTRNRLPGTITEVAKGEAAAKVTLQVGDNNMVALITRESCDELGLAVGQKATALVKATDVMILTEDGGLA